MAAILAFETLVVWLLVANHRLRPHFLVAMLACNAITWSAFYMWSMAVVRLDLPEGLNIGLGEVVVAVVEAWFLVAISRKAEMRQAVGRAIGWKRALVSTAIANAASLTLGYVAFWGYR